MAETLKANKVAFKKIDNENSFLIFVKEILKVKRFQIFANRTAFKILKSKCCSLRNFES